MQKLSLIIIANQLNITTMKKYITVKVWNYETAPSVVGHFDTIADAQAFAELSHKTEPEYNFAVAEVVYVTK